MKVELIDRYGSEHTIINAARVSVGNDTPESSGKPLTENSDIGLLRRLIKDQHGTPFEHAGFIFKIEAPIFVMHQLQRHRWSSFNEQSGRYKEFDPVFYLPLAFRKQSGKAMDYKFDDFDDKDNLAVDTYLDAIEEAYSSYKLLLTIGVAREHARMVLPTCTFTSAYWTVNVRSLANFLSLRLDAHAQKEIQELATLMYGFFESNFPNCAAIYNEIASISREVELAY